MVKRLAVCLRLSALASIVMLAGCYVSTKPLITPKTADYPIADGTHFDRYVPAGKPGEYRLTKTGRTLRRTGAYYYYVEDNEPKKSIPFLLKKISDKNYIAQMADSRDPAKVGEYGYQWLTFDKKAIVQYSANCPARQEWVIRELLDRIENTATPRCIVSNMEKLATVLKEAAKNAAPEAKFVLSPAKP
jgi:hypothetical protein